MIYNDYGDGNKINKRIIHVDKIPLYIKLVTVGMLCFPFTIFSINVSGYPISISFLSFAAAAIALSVKLIVERRVSQLFSYYVLSLICWIIASGLFSGSINSIFGSFVFSLFIFLTFGSSWMCSFHNAKYFIYSFFLTIPFLLFDLIRSFVSLPSISDLLGLSIAQSTYSVGGFYRTMATFSEPSNYALYLVFVFIVSDIVLKRTSMVKWFQALIFICLLSTLSISGITTLLAYYIIRLLTSSSINILIKAMLFLLVPVGCYTISTTQIGTDDGLSVYIQKRSNNIISALSPDTTYSTSESTRLSAIGIMPTYVSKEGWLHGMFFAEGFNNFSEWLIIEAPSPENSSFGRGTVQNAFTAVMLGSGIVGLFLYLLSIGSIFMKLNRRFKLELIAPPIIAWICGNLASGQIIVYPLIGYLMIVVIAFYEGERLNE